MTGGKKTAKELEEYFKNADKETKLTLVILTANREEPPENVSRKLYHEMLKWFKNYVLDREA